MWEPMNLPSLYCFLESSLVWGPQKILVAKIREYVFKYSNQESSQLGSVGGPPGGRVGPAQPLIALIPPASRQALLVCLFCPLFFAFHLLFHALRSFRTSKGMHIASGALLTQLLLTHK